MSHDRANKKNQILANLWNQNVSILVDSLADAHAQLDEKDARIAELEAKVKELETAMDKAPAPVEAEHPAD